MNTRDDRITDISFFQLDLELVTRFAVSSGAMEHVEMSAVRVQLASGHQGWGEMSPFPAITGETRQSTLEAARAAAPTLLGESVLEYRRLFGVLAEHLPRNPAARCGLETALLDAFSQNANLPLWAHFGGAELNRIHVTDITIPVTDLATTLALARDWYVRGFRSFKLKVGVEAEQEIEKVRRIAETCAGVSFILDANGGYELSEARRFLSGLKQRQAVSLLEQPLSPHDHEGARALREEFGLRVAADESARSVSDVVALAGAQAADVINLKIMKTGLREAVQMAIVARALGLSLMIGGMIETRLAMGCSFALVVGLGRFEFLDLDTPLLLRTDPWRGGFTYRGPELVASSDPGLGMRPAESSSFSACGSVNLEHV